VSLTAQSRTRATKNLILVVHFWLAEYMQQLPENERRIRIQNKRCMTHFMQCLAYIHVFRSIWQKDLLVLSKADKKKDTARRTQSQ
jgi:hypothetical protein